MTNAITRTKYTKRVVAVHWALLIFGLLSVSEISWAAHLSAGFCSCRCLRAYCVIRNTGCAFIHPTLEWTSSPFVLVFRMCVASKKQPLPVDWCHCFVKSSLDYQVSQAIFDLTNVTLQLDVEVLYTKIYSSQTSPKRLFINRSNV